ncbi:hypothetical protein [uncultured Sphingomonas sp.]|uniref:hypothetical protein n=1 Tax=uncultured Sphingomonas sp. TaxID=158754 RepID=UPI0035CB5503
MLAAAGLGLDITSSNGVLAERSYCWVHVTLYRRATRVVGGSGRSVTTLSRTASTPEADDVMMGALSEALEDLAQTPERYIESVASEESRLRQALAIRPR